MCTTPQVSSELLGNATVFFFKVSDVLVWKELETIEKLMIILQTWHLDHKYLVFAAISTTRIENL